MKKRLLSLMVLLTMVFAHSCTKPQTTEFKDEALQASDASVISVEAAVGNLLSFLSDTKLTKAKSGLDREIASIETYFSLTRRNAKGEAIPDAYLVNFENEAGFAILGANSDIDPVVAVVESGNTHWEDIMNPKEHAPSSFELGCPDPGIRPEKLLSMCIRGALYGRDSEQEVQTKEVWTTEVLPLTGSQAFTQQITYCHKSNRGFVTSGCAATALSIIMAYNQYPYFVVDSEYLDYSDCNASDGQGYKYTFSDGNTIYIQLNDYFTNSGSIPTNLDTTQIRGLITMIDNGVISTHGTPTVSTAPNQYFKRTRFKLSSGVFYKLSNIIQSWDATGTMPAAVEDGLEDLGYIAVSRKKESSLTNKQIDTLCTMLINNKPTVMCGWSLFDLSNSHYWVVDGIRKNSTTTHIHCNWGWGWSYNGWYSSKCIRPAYQVPTTQTGNDWGNIIVYAYHKQSSIPYKGVYTFENTIPVRYE